MHHLEVLRAESEVEQIPEHADRGYVVPRRMKYEKDVQTAAGDDDDDSVGRSRGPTCSG